MFSTSNRGEKDTVWVVTRHEAEAGRVEFARFTPGSRTCLLKIAVSALGADRSHVDVSYAYTPLGEAGNRFLEGWTEEAFLEAVVFWKRWMNHFLRTGGKLMRDAG